MFKYLLYLPLNNSIIHIILRLWQIQVHWICTVNFVHFESKATMPLLPENHEFLNLEDVGFHENSARNIFDIYLPLWAILFWGFPQWVQLNDVLKFYFRSLEPVGCGKDDIGRWWWIPSASNRISSRHFRYLETEECGTDAIGRWSIPSAFLAIPCKNYWKLFIVRP